MEFSMTLNFCRGDSLNAPKQHFLDVDVDAKVSFPQMLCNLVWLYISVSPIKKKKR